MAFRSIDLSIFNDSRADHSNCSVKTKQGEATKLNATDIAFKVTENTLTFTGEHLTMCHKARCLLNKVYR